MKTVQLTSFEETNRGEAPVSFLSSLWFGEEEVFADGWYVLKSTYEKYGSLYIGEKYERSIIKKRDGKRLKVFELQLYKEEKQVAKMEITLYEKRMDT